MEEFMHLQSNLRVEEKMICCIECHGFISCWKGQVEAAPERYDALLDEH